MGLVTRHTLIDVVQTTDEDDDAQSHAPHTCRGAERIWPIAAAAALVSALTLLYVAGVAIADFPRHPPLRTELHTSSYTRMYTALVPFCGTTDRTG